MGRFTKTGTNSEAFHEAMKNAGAVECSVCQIRFGQGNKGMSLNVCEECLEYVCNEHLYRHPNCCEGR